MAQLITVLYCTVLSLFQYFDLCAPAYCLIHSDGSASGCVCMRERVNGRCVGDCITACLPKSALCRYCTKSPAACPQIRTPVHNSFLLTTDNPPQAIAAALSSTAPAATSPCLLFLFLFLSLPALSARCSGHDNYHRRHASEPTPARSRLNLCINCREFQYGI